MRKFLDKKLLVVDDGANKLSLWSLALPLFIEGLATFLIGIIQTAMSARYHGGVFVIPVTLASSIFTTCFMLIGIIPNGLSILLSIQIGRKDVESCKKLAGVSLLFSEAFTVVLTLFGCVFADRLLLLLGMDKPDYLPYLEYAVIYFRIRCVGMVLQNITNVLTTVMRCYGHVAPTAIRGVINNGLGALLTALVVFVFNVPKDYGAFALGMVTIVTTIISLLMTLWFFFDKKIPMSLRWSGKWLKRVLIIGTPASVSSISYQLSQAVTAIICLSLTPSAYLAKNYLAQLVYFVYLFGYTIGQANAIMIGRLCGAEKIEQADLLQRQNLKIVLLCNGVTSLVFMGLGKYLLGWFYAADESVVAYATIILAIDFFVEIGRGMNHIGQFGLNAAGDVRFTTMVSVLSCWACSIGLSALFVLVFKWDLYGMWIAFAVDELFRGILYMVRWKREGWRKHLIKE